MKGFSQTPATRIGVRSGGPCGSECDMDITLKESSCGGRYSFWPSLGATSMPSISLRLSCRVLDGLGRPYSASSLSRADSS
jgi:hypothetical protein